MLTVRLGNTRLRCSPILLAALPAAFIFGREAIFLVAFLSLSVHEAAHAAVARRLGYAVGSIEIQPFGFVARLDCRLAHRGELAAIYAAGPAASLVLAAFSALIGELLSSPVFSALGLTQYNLLIAAVNLLPALPLDGGRLIHAAVSSRGAHAAQRVLRAAGMLTGVTFLTLFGLLLARGCINPTFAIMGAFLTAAAFREREPLLPPAMRHKRLVPGSALPVADVAFSGETSLASALGMLPAGRYSLVSVVDNDLSRRAVLDENRLREAAVRLGASAKLSDAVALFDKSVI